MPRPPAVVPDIAALSSAVFSPVAARALAAGRVRFPLHVGDTWLEPPEGARMEDLRAADHPGLHRYGDTRGEAPLRAALAERVREHHGLESTPESVLVTGGATAGLAAAASALVAPGDEVVILAPFWPLVRGIVRTARGRPVEAPFYDRVRTPDEAAAAVEAVRSARTVALYVSTPSNPTGRTIPGPWLEALAAWARTHELWILSDEVYADLTYGTEHVSIGRFAPERTVTAFSFSKTWAMAGDRVGWLTGPPRVVEEIHKVAMHTLYHAPVAAQMAALRALERGGPWLARARARYREIGERSAQVLGVDPPEGGTFLFVDAAPALDARGMDGLLEDCLEDGLLVAPGASSGMDYATWVRVCFTACPPGETEEAVALLAKRLGRDAGDAARKPAAEGAP